MVESNGRFLCENCFEEMNPAAVFCTRCGYNPNVVMSDPTMLKPGSILLGKYVVGKTMGKGGFGITYLAYDVTANRKVAIKEFFPYGVALRAAGSSTVSVASMDNADAFKNGAEKFYSEAKLVSKFNGNPNIVGVYEFFYENDTVYFAMEYLKGHTLKEHIDEHGTLKPAQALYIAQGIANALMAAHSSNILHRDISPDNIIVCDNGEIKLIDFGAARQVVAEHSQSFSVILKPGFAPLEQYQKKGKQGPWTDIYSLGATIYYALTQDIPDDPMSRMSDDEEYSSNMYNIDPGLWKIISRATQLNIEDRYGDIFQLKSDLSALTIEAEPLVVPPAGTGAEKMPEFKTAMPFGMTQTGGQQAQPVPQPVGVGAPVQPMQQAAVQEAVPAEKKSANKKAIAIAISGAAVAAAAAIIIPISVNSAKNSANGSKPSYTDSMPTGTGSHTSKPSINNSSPEIDLISVEDMYLDEGYRYTGTWANGKPQGFGSVIYSDDEYYEFERGVYDQGALSDGQYLYVYEINGNTGLCYTFRSGSWDDIASFGKLNGEGYEEFKYEPGDLYDHIWGRGTFLDGVQISGEYLTKFDDGTYLLQVGTFWEVSGALNNGYFLEFSANGSITRCSKFTSSSGGEFPLSEAEKVSELQKYFDPSYLKNSISDHFGYADEFNTIKKEFTDKTGIEI